MNGTCIQAISGTGSVTGSPNSTIEIANSDGVTLNTNLTTGGNVKLTNGLLTLGSNDLVFGTSSMITGIPSASAMIVATGAGQVKKEFSSAGSFTYPVGDHTEIAEYSPVTLEFTGGTFGSGNYAGVNLVNAKYPADPNTMNYLKRYWTLNSTGITGFSCNALFLYVPADVTGTEGQIHCVKVDPVPFTPYGVTNSTLHQLTASNLSSFGAFTGTEAAPNVYIVSGSGTYCQGSPGLPVSLSGSQTNVTYQLKKNGIDLGAPVAGTGLPLTWTNQLAGTYTVAGTNITGNTLMNGSAVIEEIPSAAVAVSIVAHANPVCEGTLVIFTATPVNGGQSPVYQWKVNGVNAGTNSIQFAYTPVNGDAVLCILTSDEACATGNPAISNTVVMSVSPIVPVSLTIDASANPVCPNTPVTFTATPVNAGNNPQYQWKVNGVNAGTNVRTYSFIPGNNDAVTCILTSSQACIQGNPGTSNTVNMIVNEIQPVSVSIAASANPVCTGAVVNFTASPVNGGPNPVFQWKVNGINVGTNSALYTYVPANNDHVFCIMTSNLQCVSCNPAISNTSIMTVNSGVLRNTTVGGTVGANQDTSFSASEIITVAGAASPFIVQNEGWANMFAGENIIYKPGTRVEQGGYMHGAITSTGLNCGMLAPSFLTVREDDPGKVNEKSSFVVYPNPSSGIWTLEQKGVQEYENLRVELFGLQGEKVMTNELTGSRKHEFSLSEAPAGLYFMRIFSENSTETVRIMKH